MRRCLLNGDPVIFHCFENYSRVIEASPMVGGHPAGQISRVYAIVEHMSGQVSREEIQNIKFPEKADESVCRTVSAAEQWWYRMGAR